MGVSAQLCERVDPSHWKRGLRAKLMARAPAAVSADES
jgi:hypothetical protein